MCVCVCKGREMSVLCERLLHVRVCVCVCVCVCVSELIRMHVTFKSLKVGLVYHLVSVATSINLISPIQIYREKNVYLKLISDVSLDQLK